MNPGTQNFLPTLPNKFTASKTANWLVNGSICHKWSHQQNSTFGNTHNSLNNKLIPCPNVAQIKIKLSHGRAQKTGKYERVPIAILRIEKVAQQRQPCNNRGNACRSPYIFSVYSSTQNARVGSKNDYCHTRALPRKALCMFFFVRARKIVSTHSGASESAFDSQVVVARFHIYTRRAVGEQFLRCATRSARQ
jgi:hypothetical protein